MSDDADDLGTDGVTDDTGDVSDDFATADDGPVQTAANVPAYMTMDWEKACWLRQGTPTADPANPGGHACRFDATPAPTPSNPNPAQQWRYETASLSLSDLLTYAGTASSEATDAALGKIGDAATTVTDALGLDNGVTGLAGKVLGVPHWMVVVLAIVALYMVGVGAGIVPPLKKLVR